MSALFDTLLGRYMLAQQQQQQRMLDQQQREREDNRFMQQNLLASQQQAEQAKQNEFDRKYKLAELQGKYAGALGQQMPTGYEDPAVAEYARTGYAGGQVEAQKKQHDMDPLALMRLQEQQREFGLRQDQASQFHDENNALRQFLTTNQIQQRAYDNAQQRNLRQDQYTDTQASHLGTKLDQLGAVKSDMDELAKVALSKEAVPGHGPILGHVPSIFLSDAGAEHRRRAQRILNAILLANGGKNQTVTEKANTLAATDLAPTSTDEQFKNGIRELSHLFRSVAQQQQAGYRPDAVARIAQRGGVTADDLTDLTDSGSPTPTIPTKPQKKAAPRISRTDPTTGETRYWNGSAWVPE